MLTRILVCGVAFLAMSSLASSPATAATISYQSSGAILRADVEAASPSFGIVTVVDQTAFSGFIPNGGSGNLFIDQEDPGSPISFNGTIDLTYDIAASSSGFDINVAVPTFNLPSDVTAFTVWASATIEFTVDMNVDAILTGSSPASGETIEFVDLDESQYFWSETLNGPPTGTRTISLTPGVVYRASVWTGFGQESPSLSLSLVPEPGTALLMGLGLIGLARRRR